MDKYLSNFLNVITDKSQSLFRRLKYFLFVVFLIFGLNEYSGFLFNYQMNQKINQLQQIQEIYPDSLKKSSSIIEKFKEYEIAIIERKNIFEKITIEANSFYSRIKKDSEPTKDGISIWGILLYILNYYSFFILIAIITPFYAKGEDGKFKDKLAFFLTMGFLGIFTNLIILGVMPKFSYWIVNFIINFFAQFLVLIFFASLGNLAMKKK